MLGSYDAPVMIRGQKNASIINSTVTRGGRDALQIISKGSLVANNDFSYSNLIADDCALLYTIGANLNMDIHHNWFHDATRITSYNVCYTKLLRSTEQVNFINYNAELSYKININNHELKLFGGYRDYMDNVYWLIDSTSYDTRILETMPQIYPRGSMIIYNDRGSMTRTLRSGYYHANYNYNQKYTLSFAGNYSALYEMDKHVVSAFFPSTAVNWDVSKEKWLSGVEKLNALNLYVNWGQVGNFRNKFV